MVTRTDDGFTAEVPSIKGCESWAHNEEEAINKTVELLKFYLQSSPDKKIIVDKARREQTLTVYKLIFDPSTRSDPSAAEAGSSKTRRAGEAGK